ncbi:MAG: hypothetical protein LBR73_00445 [Oscillospiraceae bacterium]|jgi:alpha-N-arabinofuranosidase|nr:hypothetical protein [Oscillospiraceae bacterium]
MKKMLCAAVLLFSSIALTGCSSMNEVTVRINTAAPVGAVPETLYGVFFEDINYAGDGGLYPELVLNRSFENRPLNPADYDLQRDAAFGWDLEGASPLQFSKEGGLNENNPTFAKLSLQGACVLRNKGFGTDEAGCDIPIQAGAAYDLQLFYRHRGYRGKITVSVEGAQGQVLLPPQEIPLSVMAPAGWMNFRADSIIGALSGKGKLCIRFDGVGDIDIDYVSLMPEDTHGFGQEAWKYGGLRRDLVDALANLQPRFVRFPGGCIVEGRYQHSQAYHWKDTIGAPYERKENPNLWGYMQTYGLGYHEYFQLCRDLGAEPLPVIYAGVLCQGGDAEERKKYEQNYAPGDPGLAALAEEILDLIEYANGAADTVWGSQRAANGSAEPFGLKYIAIGNENFGEQYFANLRYLKTKVLEQHPEITIVSSCGWSMSGDQYEESLASLLPEHSDTIIDMHRYTGKKWLTGKGFKFFRTGAFPAGTRIFMGEYAGHNEERTNNLEMALSEAAFMTGMEQSGGTVVMASYAPLFARVGMEQWKPDLIWFTEDTIKLTPSYQVQKLFSAYQGTTELEAKYSKSRGVFASAQSDAESVIVKLVNPYAREKVILLKPDSKAYTAYAGELLAGNPEDLETVPTAIAGEAQGGEVRLVLPGYSLAAIRVF